MRPRSSVSSAALQLVHPSGRDEDSGLEGADELVVLLDGARQGLAHGGHVPAEGRESRVEVLPDDEQLAGVLLEGVLLPDGPDGAQHGEQRAGGGEHDLA